MTFLRDHMKSVVGIWRNDKPSPTTGVSTCPEAFVECRILILESQASHSADKPPLNFPFLFKLETYRTAFVKRSFRLCAIGCSRLAKGGEATRERPGAAKPQPKEANHESNDLW